VTISKTESAYFYDVALRQNVEIKNLRGLNNGIDSSRLHHYGGGRGVFGAAGSREGKTDEDGSDGGEDQEA
jgi:hypothetical protein